MLAPIDAGLYIQVPGIKKSVRWDTGSNSKARKWAMAVMWMATVYETRDNRIPVRGGVGDWTKGRCVTVSADERGVKRVCGWSRYGGTRDVGGGGESGWTVCGGAGAPATPARSACAHAAAGEYRFEGSSVRVSSFCASPTPCAERRGCRKWRPQWNGITSLYIDTPALAARTGPPPCSLAPTQMGSRRNTSTYQHQSRYT